MVSGEYISSISRWLLIDRKGQHTYVLTVIKRWFGVEKQRQKINCGLKILHSIELKSRNFQSQTRASKPEKRRARRVDARNGTVTVEKLIKKKPPPRARSKLEAGRFRGHEGARGGRPRAPVRQTRPDRSIHRPTQRSAVRAIAN